LIEKQGPYFENTVKSSSDLDKLKISDPESDLAYVAEAIKITKRALNNNGPLIGFAGAPWTIFSYMIEGSGSKTFSKARKMLYTNPELSHKLLDMITQSTIKYLKMQINSGADLVQIFDSWAGILPTVQYEAFALKYISQICDAITEVPITVFAKGAFASRKAIGSLNCETIGLDWNMDIEESRSLIGDQKTLQGNLDPCILYGSYREIEKATKEMLRKFGGHKHIANLGHGVYPDMEADKVRCFIDTVKNS
jgi:uroporphyrinogen decarboxylase